MERRDGVKERGASGRAVPIARDVDARVVGQVCADPWEVESDGDVDGS